MNLQERVVRYLMKHAATVEQLVMRFDRCKVTMYKYIRAIRRSYKVEIGKAKTPPGKRGTKPKTYHITGVARSRRS